MHSTQANVNKYVDSATGCLRDWLKSKYISGLIVVHKYRVKYILHVIEKYPNI